MALVSDCGYGYFCDGLAGLCIPWGKQEERIDMLRFKVTAIRQMLEERKPELTLAIYQKIKKAIDEGAEDIDHFALSRICRDLQCLPTDIVQFV
jgi:DNA-binding Xre family transcriptional regulator